MSDCCYLNLAKVDNFCPFFFFFFLHKIRLCALNDDSSEESDHEPTQESVKQAKVGSTLIISCSCTVQLMN